MKTSRLLSTALTLGLLITPVLEAAASMVPQPVYNQQGQVIGTTKTQPAGGKGISLPAGYYILDTEAGDVTGDGVSDNVYFTGHKNKAEDAYADKLGITVKNGTTGALTAFSLDKVGGYQAQLFLGDFSGDKAADVLASAASGGSGGWSYHSIVSFKGGQPKEIFGLADNENAAVAGKFINGWKAELTYKGNGQTVTMDVKDRQADYVRLGIYNQDGTVKEETSVMTAPFSLLEPVDTDKDGVFELKGLQRIAGAYRADGLADVETVLKYNGTGWQAQAVKVMINLAATGTAKPEAQPAPAAAIEKS